MRVESEMRVLVVYFSFTGQAERVAGQISETLRERGHTPMLCRVAFADAREPTQAPVPFSLVLAWGKRAQSQADVAVVYTPEVALSGTYDLIILLSTTWNFTACSPIQTFLRSPEARVLKGRPVAIGIVCRGFWKGNLALSKRLVAAAGGNFIASEIFTHPGAWLTSTITNIYGMTRAYPLPKRFGPLRLPAFGISPESMAKIPAFVGRAVAAALLVR